MSAKVLVVEDDKPTRKALCLALEMEGYEVSSVGDGKEALDAVEKDSPDIIILDRTLPILDGLTVCRELRNRNDFTPVLILSARGEAADRIEGLKKPVLADDYMAKPPDIEELLHRVAALLRRDNKSQKVLKIGDLVLDSSSRSVTLGTEEILLTKLEFDLLELFMLNEGIVLSRDRLYEDIWGYRTDKDARSLEVYVGQIRKKLEKTSNGRMIHTVRGIGYVLKPPEGKA